MRFRTSPNEGIDAVRLYTEKAKTAYTSGDTKKALSFLDKAAEVTKKPDFEQSIVGTPLERYNTYIELTKIFLNRLTNAYTEIAVLYFRRAAVTAREGSLGQDKVEAAVNEVVRLTIAMLEARHWDEGASEKGLETVSLLRTEGFLEQAKTIGTKIMEARDSEAKQQQQAAAARADVVKAREDEARRLFEEAARKREAEAKRLEQEWEANQRKLRDEAEAPYRGAQAFWGNPNLSPELALQAYKLAAELTKPTFLRSSPIVMGSNEGRGVNLVNWMLAQEKPKEIEKSVERKEYQNLDKWLILINLAKAFGIDNETTRLVSGAFATLAPQQYMDCVSLGDANFAQPHQSVESFEIGYRAEERTVTRYRSGLRNPYVDHPQDESYQVKVVVKVPVKEDFMAPSKSVKSALTHYSQALEVNSKYNLNMPDAPALRARVSELNDEINALLAQTAAEVDAAKKREMSRRIQAVLSGEEPSLDKTTR